MRPIVTIVAMINGMIGGLILVLPILAKQGGVIMSGLVICVCGFFSFYSCYLCLIHLGNFSDLDKALVYHFNGSRIVQIFYDFLVFLNLLLILLLYFNLIVQQWEGLVPHSIANPIANGFALLFLIILLNFFHFGAQLLGYGIISIIGYCIFLIWMLASAPKGDNHIPMFGQGAVNLAASMGQAFSIQTFFIPVLREIKGTTATNIRYTGIAYIIGASTYLYIAYTGSFGTNRFIQES